MLDGAPATSLISSILLKIRVSRVGSTIVGRRLSLLQTMSGNQGRRLPMPPPAGVDGGDGSGGFQDQIDSLLHLVTARARGEVRSEMVEEAIAHRLQQSQPTGSARAAPSARTVSARNEKVVIEDDDNYDDLDDDDNTSDRKPLSADGGSRGTKRRRSSSIPSPPPVAAKDDDEEYVSDGGDTQKNDEEEQEGTETIDQSKQWDELDAIPLGRQGAKMLVTFGDGRNPRPKTVEAALLVARRLVQHAVRDARALRRKHKAEYKKAQAAASLHGTRPRHIDQKTVDSVIAGETTVDSSMLFRAIGGYDRLSYDPKCGFDVPELEVLFPEEMMAYQRWKRMQKAYAQSKEDRGDGEAMDGGDNDDNEDGDVGDEKAEQTDRKKKDDDKDTTLGGHLNRRLQQFDARTEQMKEKWYLSFSEVRQGSFIDKATGVDGRMWRQAQKKTKGKGRNKAVTWESLPAGCVTFLHWVGFDLTSSIPPPNEATANALAFLAYDFLGKVVEKAIFLRRLAQREKIRAGKGRGNVKGDDSNDGDDFLLELKGTDQLTAEDIDRSLNDSTIVSEPLYGATNSSLGGTGGSKPQLYFGPGFEERLEMEMEE